MFVKVHKQWRYDGLIPNLHTSSGGMTVFANMLSGKCLRKAGQLYAYCHVSRITYHPYHVSRIRRIARVRKIGHCAAICVHRAIDSAIFLTLKERNFVPKRNWTLIDFLWHL